VRRVSYSIFSWSLRAIIRFTAERSSSTLQARLPQAIRQGALAASRSCTPSPHNTNPPTTQPTVAGDSRTPKASLGPAQVTYSKRQSRRVRSDSSRAAANARTSSP